MTPIRNNKYLSSISVVNIEQNTEFFGRSVFLICVFLTLQTSAFALALGTIVHGLSVCGHGKAEDLRNKLMPAWIKTLIAEVKEFAFTS